MVSEQLSGKDVEQMSELMKDGMNDIINKSLENAKTKIDDAIDESIETSTAKVEREMEKESNDKVMYIKEYADGVLEEIHNTHEEVMFLYNMLNDKQDELKDSVSQAAVIGKRLRDESESYSINDLADTDQQQTHDDQLLKGIFEREARTEDVSNELEKMSANAFTSDMLVEKSFRDKIMAGSKKLELAKKTAAEIAQANIDKSEPNNNDKILELYRSGISEKDIAMELGIGRGEVKLVIDLYKGAHN